VNPFARQLLLTGGIVVAAIASSGCEKAKEDPIPAQATVIMPGTPAPADASASMVAPATASSMGTTSVLPPATTDTTSGISAGNSGPSTGGTVSVIPAASPTPVAAVPDGGTAAPANPPADTSVLPPSARTTSLPGPGVIGSAASDTSDNQPPSKAPGSKP